MTQKDWKPKVHKKPFNDDTKVDVDGKVKDVKKVIKEEEDLNEKRQEKFKKIE